MPLPLLPLPMQINVLRLQNKPNFGFVRSILFRFQILWLEILEIYSTTWQRKAFLERLKPLGKTYKSKTSLKCAKIIF